MTAQQWTLLHDEHARQAMLEVTADALLLDVADFTALLGWKVRDNTLCRDDRCLPLSLHPRLVVDGKVNLQAFAGLQQMPLVVDAEKYVLAVGESVEVQGALLQSAMAPDFSLPDASGKLHRLSDYRGKKILLVAWASWCGCREDLPVWQALYEEYRECGFTVITVAQDAQTADALPFIAAAGSQHPALIDNDHLVSRRYGFINVPTVVWIDENGRIARPPRVEHGSNQYTFVHQLDCEPHLQALRHWISSGETDFSQQQTVEQMLLPTFDEQLARTEHALAWYLFQQGETEAANMHWDRAIALAPHDWTIRRGSMRLRGEDPFGNDFFQVWDAWEKAGKPDYISLAAQRRAERPS